MVEPSVIGGFVILGIVIFLFGLLQNRNPYGVARFSEQSDAVGSKTDLDSVEPADWKVNLTYWSSYLWMLVGIGMIISAGVLVYAS
jgi:hypothetical protein